MRSSKDRTIEKKRRSKATKAQKTEASRRKRLANKAKREEIHAIDPDMKIAVKNQRTFDQYGNEVEVIDGKIKPVRINGIYKLTDEPAQYEDAVTEYQETIDDNIIDKIKIKNRSALERLTDKLRKK
jgi:hypothetical protein